MTASLSLAPPLYLVGRDREKARLKAAIQDSGRAAVVIRGVSGIGKTALVMDVAGEMGSGVLFGVGKYAEGEVRNGFLPILTALSQAVDQALDLLYDPHAGLESLIRAVGPGFDLLSRSGLQVLGGTADPAAPGRDPITAQASAARLADAVMRVVDWLNGFGAPVVLFIDDWQRAPAEVQTLAAALARDDRRPMFTLVLAERDAPTPAPDAPMLDALAIDLEPLAAADRQALLARSLGDEASAAAALRWLGEAGGGLPLALLESARALSEAAALVQDGEGWRVDDARAAAIDRGDLTATMVRRSRNLPGDARRLGLALAVWGDRAEVAVLALALGLTQSEADDRIVRLEAGGIVRRMGGEVGFLHDRLRASTLEAAGQQACVALAAEMAERLLERTGEPWTAISKPVLHLRLKGGLDAVSPEPWRDRFAVGAQEARGLADTQSSVLFAEAAWSLRQRQRSPDHELDAVVVKEAAMAAGARRDPAAVAERAELMLALARGPDAKAEAYELAINAIRLSGDAEAAWTMAQASLRHFGVSLPNASGPLQILLASLPWRLWLWLRPSRPGDGGPYSTDAMSRTSHAAGGVAFERNPVLAMLVALKTSAPAHRRGPHDPSWISGDAFLAACLGDFRLAARLGEQALAELPRGRVVRGHSTYLAAFFGAIWGRPLAEMPAYCQLAYDLALAEGDLVAAGYAVRNRILLLWRVSPKLDDLISQFADAEETADRLGDPTIIAGLNAMTDIIRRVMDGTPLAPTTDARTPVSVAIPIVRIEMLAFYGDWQEIRRFTEEMLPRRGAWSSHPGGATWRYYENLARLKQGLPARPADIRYLKTAARLNPRDHRAKLLTLEAEDLRRSGRIAAIRHYALAVEAHRESGFQLDTGVAAECAAAAAQALGDGEASERFARTALDTWAAWGARSKLPAASLDGEPTSETVRSRLAAAESQAALAQKADRAKTRFLADVSHELRTPMQSIQTLLELAADDPGSVDLAGLRDAFGSLKDVVDDLTDLGAQAGGDAALRLAPVDLATLARTELGLVGPAAAARGLKLELSIDPALPLSVVTDGVRVRQVLRNLLSNAIKYVDAGRVVVRLSGQRAGALITVEDTGPGVTEAQKTLIFEPFDRGGREEPGGLGLGLTISRRIAERLGGRLDVDNRPEGGARFSFSFPAPVSTEAPAESVSPLIAPLRVMIVDDVALIRRSFAAVLRRDGHAVVEAATVQQAIERCLDPLDLILLDLGLPDGDGVDVIAALHRHCGAGPPSPPVIVLTGSTAPERVEAALAAGAAKVLFKPVAAPELRAAIAESLGQGAQPAPLKDSYEAELARLGEQARIEVIERGRELLATVGAGSTPDLAREAHRLAGLAAQFGQATAAGLLDELEAGLKAGAVPAALLKQLDQTLADL